MFYKVFRSSFVLLFLLSTPNLAKSTEEVFDIKGRPVLSGSPVRVEEVFSTSRSVVRRRGDSLCWQITKFFGAAYLAVMGSGESSSSRSIITRSEGKNLDSLTDVPEGVASSWGLLPVAYAVETRRDEILYDWSTPEETTTESVFLSLRGNKHHKHAHQLVLLPEKSESMPSLGKKGISETREEKETPVPSSLRFAKAKMPWEEFLHHVSKIDGDHKYKMDKAFDNFGEIDSFKGSHNPSVELFQAVFGRDPGEGDGEAMGYISESLNRLYYGHRLQERRKRRRSFGYEDSDGKRIHPSGYLSRQDGMVDEEDLETSSDTMEDEDNSDNLEEEPNPAEEEEEALYDHLSSEDRVVDEEMEFLSIKGSEGRVFQKSQLVSSSTPVKGFMRFAEAKDWGHARGRVLGRPDEAAAIVQFGVENENGKWFTQAMAADANARGDRAEDVFYYLDQHAPITWQKLRAEVAHWAIPIMVAGNFQAYGTPAAINPAVPLRIFQASHMRANLRDESVCAAPPCVGFEFEIPTFTMVYHQADGQHHIPKESKVGLLYNHGGKFKYVGELGGTLEVVTFPLSTGGDHIRDSALSLSNRLRTLHDSIDSQEAVATIRVRNDNGVEYKKTHNYQDTAFMETELIHKMRPNVLFPFGSRPIDTIRFGLDDRGEDPVDETIIYKFRLHPHVTLGVAPEKLSKFLYLTRDITYEGSYGHLFLYRHKRLTNAARGRLNLGDGSAVTCNRDSAGAGLAWLIGTYLETYEDNGGEAFSGNDPKRKLPIMARTNFRALAQAVHDHDENWDAFIRCLGNYMSNATPRYFDEGDNGVGRLTDLFRLESIEDARQSELLGGHRVFAGTTYPSERGHFANAGIRDLYGHDDNDPGVCGGPTVESWLYSIIHNIGGDVADYAGKDLLSPPPCFHLHDTHPEGMGSMGMKDALAILELRSVKDPCKNYARRKTDCTISQLTGIISTTEGLKQTDDGKIEFFMERFKKLSEETHTETYY